MGSDTFTLVTGKKEVSKLCFPARKKRMTCFFRLSVDGAVAWTPRLEDDIRLNASLRQ
jgi:hypothetical protein